MSIELGYYNDGKDKLCSHEIGLANEYRYIEYINAFRYNPYEVIGCGNTKEEALEDFKNKFQYLMNELNAFSRTLFETNVATVDIDCFGKKIVN